MKLIVGLGNPGIIYRNSRHNIGFLVAKALAKNYKILFKKDSGICSLSGRGKIEASNVAIAMPLTSMNLSGVAVSSLLKKYKVDLDSLLVICDDVDLEFGRLKIRPAGSSGGHRGLESIIDTTKDDSFCRLRIGIGRPKKNIDTAQFVLSSFNKEEKTKLEDIIEKASDCCRVWVDRGISQSMNIFNRSTVTQKNSSKERR